MFVFVNSGSFHCEVREGVAVALSLWFSSGPFLSAGAFVSRPQAALLGGVPFKEVSPAHEPHQVHGNHTPLFLPSGTGLHWPPLLQPILTFPQTLTGKRNALLEVLVHLEVRGGCCSPSPVEGQQGYMDSASSQPSLSRETL